MLWPQSHSGFSDKGVFSTLDEFRNSDISSMPGNAKARNKSGYNHKVKTISLNEVVKYSNNILSREIAGRIVVDTHQ